MVEALVELALTFLIEIVGGMIGALVSSSSSSSSSLSSLSSGGFTLPASSPDPPPPPPPPTLRGRAAVARAIFNRGLVRDPVVRAELVVTLEKAGHRGFDEESALLSAMATRLRALASSSVRGEASTGADALERGAATLDELAQLGGMMIDDDDVAAGTAAQVLTCGGLAIGASVPATIEEVARDETGVVIAVVVRMEANDGDRVAFVLDHSVTAKRAVERVYRDVFGVRRLPTIRIDASQLGHRRLTIGRRIARET